MSLRLSVLDRSSADALLPSVQLAKDVDELGFTRYWVAERHILAATLLGSTTNLRIGSTGVRLPRADPTEVSKTFRVLSGLFPGRVDLAIARAHGPDAAFNDQVRGIRWELGTTPPELWLLGAELGPAFRFDRRVDRPARRAALAVNVIAAETDARATDLARWSRSSALIAGPIERVRAALVTVAAAHRVEELIVNTAVPDPADRLRSYQLLAEAFDLRSATGRAAA
jgi:alkanesulfonate monooxygenase SsuD/methylene tetrahydromethanopterin reductase-like flavin-dependent oxidoreductase (luciferase family)